MEAPKTKTILVCMNCGHEINPKKSASGAREVPAHCPWCHLGPIKPKVVVEKCPNHSD